MDLASADRSYLWHPFTQQQGWCEEEPLIVDHADGTDLVDIEGTHYIDGVSSLWCNVHGHRHPRIDAAVRDQLDKVAHSTMLGLSHEPAIELARRLVEIAPPGLARVFYSDSGSTAAEIALKMAFQYWQQRDEPARKRFICLRDAYHGDTIGSVSVGGIDLFHSLYRPLLFDTLKAEPGNLYEIERLLEEHGGEVAAVIMEPLVQGAAGMVMHPRGYLHGVRELCNRHGVLLILDEVATGFGRTGRMFACEHEGVAPDILCVAKGLTGGYLPLAATLATEEIYQGFLGEHEQFRTFFHGHTYTGNPLACAAAIATLDVFEEERTLERMEPKVRLLGPAARAARASPRGGRGAAARLHGRDRAGRLPGRAAHGPPRHARGAPARSDHPPARRRGGADASALDRHGRAPPPGRDLGRGDRRRPGDRGAANGEEAGRGRPARRLISPRRARSPSCARRRPGRTSRPGCPRTPCRAESRRRDRPRPGRR